jgi:flagellar basal-body rod protein FlgB
MQRHRWFDSTRLQASTIDVWISPRRARNLAKRQISDVPCVARRALSDARQQLAFGVNLAISVAMTLDQTGLQLGHFMSYLSQRQEAIASNIANVDTPGYQTRDIAMPSDFSSAMQDAAGSVIETPNLPSRNDGNNVSIDREARLLSENTMRFNIAAQMVRAELKNVRSAIEEGRA